MNDATNPDGACLRHDMACILVECHRDRLGDGVLRTDASEAALADLAALLARRLAPLIGGRYIPKRDERAVRDAAVWEAFSGRNHKEVMRQFSISRRLLYSILARRRRVAITCPPTAAARPAGLKWPARGIDRNPAK